MKELKFTITINASRAQVWHVLWDDASFRKWAGIIDPGTYMIGDLQLGSQIQFLSSENGYGVTSLVKELITNEYILLIHQADTQELGTKFRDTQWTGGAESYLLTSKKGVTELTLVVDTPPELEVYMNMNYPKALKCIKELAEKI